MNIKLPEPVITDYLNKCAGIADALERRDRGEFVVRLMAYTEFRDMKYPEFANVAERQFSEAFKDHDWDFFKRLGRTLNDSPRSFFNDEIRNNKLASLILATWENGFGGGGDARLKECSDDVIVKIAQHVLENKGHSLDSVRKTRQRLGLPKAEKPRFTKFKPIGKTGFELS